MSTGRALGTQAMHGQLSYLPVMDAMANTLAKFPGFRAHEHVLADEHPLSLMAQAIVEHWATACPGGTLPSLHHIIFMVICPHSSVDKYPTHQLTCKLACS